MNRILLLSLIILIFSTGVFAQERRSSHPHRYLHERRGHGGRHKLKARPNVITANAGVGGISSELAASIGIEYERFIDKDGFFSISVPLAVYAAGTVGEFDYGDTRIKINGVYTAPCFRYHPFGNGRRADLGLGLGIAFGSYDRLTRYINYGGQETDTRYNTSFAALLAQINVNFHASNGFMFGLHISGGPMLSSGIANGGFVQFGIKIGGGF